MRNNSDNYLDWEFKLSSYEERIFKWRPERSISQGEKLGG